MTYVLSNVLALSLFSVLLYLPGHAAAVALFRGSLARHVRLSASLVLGTLFWCAVTFALFAFQCFHASVVYGVGACGVAAGVAAWWWIRREPESGGSIPRERVTIELIVLFGSLVFAVVVLFFVALRPLMAHDSDVYHLAVPKLWAASHGFRRIPFNVYSNWPFNIELLFGLALQAKDYVLAKLVHFLFGVATLSVLYRFGARERGAYAGLLAAVLFLANPVVIFEFPEAYIDVAFGFFFLVGFWLVHECTNAGGYSRRMLLLAGITSGVLAGVKLTGLVAVGLLGLLLVKRELFDSKRRYGVRDIVLLFVVPCVVIAAPWAVKSWYYTGNPVYPALYGIFGGPEWSEGLSARLYAHHHSLGMGRGVSDYLLLPVRVILYGGWHPSQFAGRLSPVWVVWLPIAIVFGSRRKLVRELLCVSLGYFVFWAMTSQQMRFLIPILPLLSLAAAFGVVDFLAGISNGMGRRAVSLAAAGCAVVALVMALGDRIPASGKLAQFYWRHGPGAQQLGPSDVMRFVNERLPGDARILFMGFNGGFFCERDYIADSMFEASQIAEMLRGARTVQEARALLEARGITHVLFHPKNQNVRFPATILALLQDPAQATLIHRTPDGAFLLFAIKGDSIPGTDVLGCFRTVPPGPERHTRDARSRDRRCARRRRLGLV
ncbi:MAG: glycosyltransferase family 39 protein [Phycisphaerae bacterium]|nr:glycosyltransferase family 39 protein [Phycisphaerae bacterium]